MDFDLERTVDRIHNVEELQKKLRPLYCIDHYTVGKEEYIQFKEELIDLMKGCIWKQELREYPVKFKFYKEDAKVHTLELRHFLVNVFLWYPLVELHGIHVADESFIITPDLIPDVNAFIFKTTITAMKENNVKQTTINRYSADVTFDLNLISLLFSLIMGLHYSDHTFIEMYDSFKDLMEVEFSPDMQPTEIEEETDKIEEEIIKRLKADADNPIGVILRARTGLKTKQLREFMSLISLRPTLTGEVITKPVTNSLLINGLDRPSYLYIDALGARKPLIANNKDMGTFGYFGKLLSIAARTLETSDDMFACDTKRLVSYQVKTNRHLKLLAGKYYFDEEDNDYKLIDVRNTKLVGKAIKTRSVITCCAGQNKMCPMCIGTLINFNWDIKKGFSTFITEEYSKDISQNTLSTKHLLTTNSEKIEFSDEFYRYFTLVGDEIQLLSGIKNIKDLNIYIAPDEIKKVEEFDPNSTFNTYIESGRFWIVNTKTGDSSEIKIAHGKNIFIRTETSEIMNPEDGIIRLREVEDDTPIFEISIENNELVKPFFDLKTLINTEKRPGLDMDEMTIEEMAQKALDIFVDAGLSLSISSIEVMLNRICRKPDDPTKRPNFKKKNAKYYFYSLSQILERNGSFAVGMITDQLMRQITRLNIDERTDTSFIDPVFDENVSMEPFFKQREAIKAEEAKEKEKKSKKGVI